jgi:hypothetical protein
MRIESPQFYKYFFQTLKEEPREIRRYSLILLAIAIISLSVIFNKDNLLLLFMATGYSCMLIGYAIAKYSHGLKFSSIKKQVYEKLVVAHQNQVVVVRDKKSHKITYVNKAFYREFRGTFSLQSDIRLADFVVEKDLKKFVSRPKRKLAVMPYRQEDQMIQIKKADGSLHWVEVHTQHIDNKLELFTFKNVHYNEMQRQANRQFARELTERYFRGRPAINQNNRSVSTIQKQSLYAV